MSNEHFDVVIVGAGASGLYLGKLLKDSNKRALILESADVIGGRIQQLEKHGRKYDLGAEFIHGSNTILKKIVDENKWPYERVFQDIRDINKDAQMYVYLPLEGKFEYLEKLKREDKEFQKCFELLEFEKQDVDNHSSVLQYLVNNGASYRVIDFVNSLYAQTQGTSLDRLNAKGATEEYGEGTTDSNNFRLYNSFEPLIKHLASNQDIRKNSRVKRIDYSKDKVLIEFQNEKGESRTVTADKVAITAPIAIMKREEISFSPALPSLHRKAFRDIGMDGGTKVILWFKNSFWPKDFSICICSNSLFAQFWKERRYEGQNVETLVGFITGERSNRLENVPHSNIINAAIKFYDTVFGTEKNPSPASDNFVDGLLYHWGQNEHIKGSYSYQSTHDGSQLRRLSSNPIDNKVFFSGEAFSVNSGTIEGALDSATITHGLMMNPTKHHSKL